MTIGEKLKVAAAALEGVGSFFRGEDDSCGLPDVFDRLADYEPVDVTLNAGIIRALLAAEKATH